ncbi:purple acid phosphatase family protein [Archangium primigenium]|uniref:purple acid phosphatase family protein n=1 Tax=[Archangium] primigenium TaxID=2792470 RepID=UPI00195D781E|nr:metallophosphoesterase [Archangium primigenium]MBM7114839.1 metallophosphoesterase [Archangium primigenium]
MHRLHSLALGAVTALSLVTAAPARAAGLAREPYLQKVGTDSALVAFRVAASCAPTVYYGTHGSTDQQAKAPNQGTRHAIELTGLEPGTAYTYVVDACGVRTNPVTFSTASKPGVRRVHFTAVGDFGSNSRDQVEVARAMLGRTPELFLALGDNAYEAGTEAEFQRNLFEPMAPLLAQVPFFAVPGNHEYETNKGQPYFDNLYLPTSSTGGESYYSFDWGFVHFVGIDSSCALGLAPTSRCTPENQRKWVEEDLAASNAPWKIAYMHYPPWSSGEHGSQLNIRKQFAPLFEKYGVDLVLTGHDHDYERSQPMVGDAPARSGTRAPVYLVVGSGGASLRDMGLSSKPSWSVLRNNGDHGYLDVKVEGGTLTAQMLTPSGKAMDTFSLTKTLPPEAAEPAPGTPAETPAPGDSTTPPSIPGSSGSTPTLPSDKDLDDPEGLNSVAGGCSAGPAMALLPGALLVLGSALRRRRR